MNKGFGTVEIVVIVLILALGAGIYLQRKTVIDEQKSKDAVRATVSVLQGALETYKITNETARYPRSMRVNELAVLLDKDTAQQHIRFLNAAESLYISDGNAYTLIAASKTKKKHYYWSFHSTRTVFEGENKPNL